MIVRQGGEVSGKDSHVDVVQKPPKTLGSHASDEVGLPLGGNFTSEVVDEDDLGDDDIENDPNFAARKQFFSLYQKYVAALKSK